MTKPSGYSRVFFLVSFIFIVYLFIRILRPFFTPLIFAVILATLFFGWYERLSKRLRQRRALAAGLMCATITFLIIIPLVTILFVLAQQIVDAYQSVQADVQTGLEEFRSGRGPVSRLFEKVGAVFGVEGPEIGKNIGSIFQTIGAFLAGKSVALLQGLAGVLLNFFITIFTLFFLFRDGRALTEEIKACIPMAPEYKDRIIAKFSEVTHATFAGFYVTGSVQGILAMIIYWVLGVPHPVLWGTTTAIFTLVPLVGTAAVWVPVTVFLYLSGHAVKAGILLAGGILLISMADNVVRPLVIHGTSEGMHVLLIFFGVLGGISVFGFSGLVLGPVVVALMLTFLDFFKKEFRDELQL